MALMPLFKYLPDHSVRDFVAVKDSYAILSQQSRHCALSGGNATCEPNDYHRR